MTWDRTVDVLVMGSGAAGMTSALRASQLGLDALVVEKSDVWGGSVSMSAGVVWIPDNASMRAKGAEDSEEDGVTYLLHLTRGQVSEERIRRFITDGKRMVDELGSTSHVQLESVLGYPDYHPTDPGGRDGGRSMEPLPIDGTRLGAEFATLHLPYPSLLMMGKALMSIAQTRALLEPGLRAKLPAVRRVARYAADWRSRRRHGRDPFLTMGQALAARLRLSLIDRDVPVWLDCPLKELVVEDGRVTGAVVEHDGKATRVQAQRGIVIAAGGFEHNAEMRQRYQRQPIDAAWTVGNAANTGDGINLGAALGAQLDTELMKEAWWLPATPAPGLDSPSVLVIEKSMPGGIFVNQHAVRFLNEAASYTDTVLEMYRQHAENEATIPAWFVFDGKYRSKYSAGPIMPKMAMPDKKLPPAWQPGAGWLHRADTIEDLARSMGVDAAALSATVERFNGFAVAGVDEDFHRGENANDLYYADQANKPNPSLGAIQRAPFYAIPVIPGDLGTKAGLVTDSDGRVLDGDSRPIPGLYAAGNSATTVMGDRYPGAGSTIAPAMTLGFVAAEACAADTVPTPLVPHADEEHHG